MASNTLANLSQGYERLFDTLTVNSGRVDDADRIIDRIVRHRNVYDTIMGDTGVPWQIVGVLHSMESSLDFTTHLYNGDPLTARTVRVPPGRPKVGSPPFTFAESAVDALRHDKLADLSEWALPATLFRLEKYNGFGFRPKKINTPYLWSFSNHYTSGKFVEIRQPNGKFRSVFDPALVSDQCGAAVLLRRMVDREIFAFTGLPRAVDVVVNGTPRAGVSAFVQKGNTWIAPRALSEVMNGLSVVAVNNQVSRITLSLLIPGTPAVTRDFAARTFLGRGHVDASDLVRDLLKGTLQLDTATNPHRLVVTFDASL